MANLKVVRIYSGSDVDMLTAAATIIGHAKDNKAALIAKRSSWKDPFFNNIAAAIDQAFTNILGTNGVKEQKKATKALVKAMKEIVPLLGDFKTQIEVDFEDDNREKDVLLSLGYGLMPKVQKGDQEALTKLLATFTTNMSASLKQEIVAAGTDADIIDTIISYAAIIKDSNIAQEKQKGIKKTITAEGITQLNAIYKQTIGVAKIAARFMAADASKAALFSFHKTKAALNTTTTAASKIKKAAPKA
ncbi:hypothetical protein ACFOW1_13775 [Parasediminibacterium paludis]|uniref:Uncharacterized protein n=1 Tax=Parasediminibacterium paludis TaxID=908966 RepID=A0ABV8Q0D0_9BACT